MVARSPRVYLPKSSGRSRPLGILMIAVPLAGNTLVPQFLKVFLKLFDRGRASVAGTTNPLPSALSAAVPSSTPCDAMTWKRRRGAEHAFPQHRHPCREGHAPRPGRLGLPLPHRVVLENWIRALTSRFRQENPGVSPAWPGDRFQAGLTPAHVGMVFDHTKAYAAYGSLFVELGHSQRCTCSRAATSDPPARTSFLHCAAST